MMGEQDKRARRDLGAGDLVASAAGAAAPTFVSFQVTGRCNYDCPHCYQTHGRDPELTTQQIDDVLGDVASAGVLFLTLTGGEFFMRRDADQILRLARGHGFAIKLLTTGHHVDERRADLIRDLGSIEVRMSLYSANHATHDRVTLAPGSQRRTLAAARRLIARRVPVTFQSPIMNANAGELAELAELAHAAGARHSVDPKLTTRQDGDAGPLAERVPDEPLRQLYRDGQLGGSDEPWQRGPVTAPAMSATPCRAGEAVAAISPQGDVKPCQSLPITCGNLLHQRFADIWRSSLPLQRIRALAWDRLDVCRSCALRAYCSRCHAMALLEHGDLAGPSLEACRHAVMHRDALRERGVIDASETELPPTYEGTQAAARGVRSAALNVLP